MDQIILPSLGEGITSGIIVSVLVKLGDKLDLNQSILEIETDKVTMEVPSTISGIVKRISIKEGDELAVGEVILDIEADVVELDVKKQEAAEEISIIDTVIKKETSSDKQETAIEYQELVYDSSNRHKASKRTARVSPRVRKFARELSVDLEAVTPSSNLIVREDIVKYVRHNQESAYQLSKDSISIDFSKWGSVRTELMSSVMKATAKNMSQSWSEIPHAWLQTEADITLLDDERKLLNRENGLSISLTVFLIKAVEKTLRHFPKFNSSLDRDKDQLIIKDYINIGVAVDTEYGLFVPVIKNVEHLSLSQVSQSLLDLSSRAKEKKLKIQDLEGGNFTISNLGGFGTTGIFPIILKPQTGILGVASYKKRKDKKKLPLTIGFDHRVIDGADAGRFLQQLVNYLENPVKMLV